MPLTTREFNLCVIPSKFPPHVHLSQYDNAVQCTANLVDESGTTFAIPSGCTAIIEGINKKNVIFQIDATNVTTTSVVFTPSGAMTDCYGQLRATLKIESSNTRFSPLEIIFEIQKCGVTDDEAADSLIHSPDFQEQIDSAVETYLIANPIGIVGTLYPDGTLYVEDMNLVENYDEEEF